MYIERNQVVIVYSTKGKKERKKISQGPLLKKPKKNFFFEKQNSGS